MSLDIIPAYRPSMAISSTVLGTGCMLDITASIVTFRTDRNELAKAVNSFLDTSLDVRLMISDNSPDSLLSDAVRDSRVEYRHNGMNLGFGRAHNLAISRFKGMSRYHLVLNPDVSFKRGTLEAIHGFMEDNRDLGLVMPRVEYPDGRLQYLCKLMPAPFDFFFRKYWPIKSMKDRWNYTFEMRFTGYDHVMEVPYLSGCFMFMRSEVLDKIRGFDDRFFMYQEDTDLSRRFFLESKSVFFPGATIVHRHDRGAYRSRKLLFHFLVSTIRYFNKWGWVFDTDRTRTNRRIMAEYRTSDRRGKE